MKMVVRRFIALLAVSGFDRKQIQELMREIYKIPSRDVVFEVESFRQIMGLPQYYRYEERKESLSLGQGLTDSIEDKIYQLLIEEAGMAKHEACFMLGDYLAMAFPNKMVPSIGSKMGFSTWVKRVSKVFTESELLHAATKIRNLKKNNSYGVDDWLG